MTETADGVGRCQKQHGICWQTALQLMFDVLPLSRQKPKHVLSICVHFMIDYVLDLELMDDFGPPPPLLGGNVRGTLETTVKADSFWSDFPYS